MYFFITSRSRCVLHIASPRRMLMPKSAPAATSARATTCSRVPSCDALLTLQQHASKAHRIIGRHVR